MDLSSSDQLGPPTPWTRERIRPGGRTDSKCLMHKALPPDSDLEIDPESSEGLGVNRCEEPNSVQSTALSLTSKCSCLWRHAIHPFGLTTGMLMLVGFYPAI